MVAHENLLQIQHQSIDLEMFTKDGFIGPFTLLEKDAIDSTLKKCLAGIPNLFLPNALERHAVVKCMAELAANPTIISKLKPILGDDLLLWGSLVIVQKPAKKKRFHVDAEFSAIEGAAVWLGMKNVVPQKTIFLIAGSHIIPESPQELNKLHGLDLTDGQAVLAAAKTFNPDCRLVKVNITDGQFIIFHGRLWHGAENVTSKRRYAINFRYTKPSEVVRISKDGELPDAHWEEKRPACIIVNGKDDFRVNKTITLNGINKAKGLLKGAFYYLPKNFLKRFTRRKSY
jgi:hypothetical protein